MRAGLLAHDVGAGAPVQDDVDGEVGAEDVLADVAGGVGVVERLAMRSWARAISPRT
jgi:hypothetical protein